MRETREIETKYEVEADTAVPDLAAIDGVARTSTDSIFHLTAVYYDTEALDLAAHRITLRRRSGGKDDGWHLKLPDGNDRREVTTPLESGGDTGGGDPEVPEELLQWVRAIVRGRPLSPIAIIENERHTTYCHDAEDTLLGEFVDDHVHSISVLPDDSEQAWREWEYEIPDTDAAHRNAPAVDAALRAAGGRRPDAASKLVRAIGFDASQTPAKLPRKPSKISSKQLITAALVQYRDKLIREDPRVRARRDDSVHQMRVATRQLRSVLTEFSKYFTGPARAALSSELKELASILGEVRDAEVLAARFERLEVTSESDGAGAALAERRRAAEQRGWRRVDAALESDRYFLLLDAIDTFIADPPFRSRAHRPAVKELAPALSKRMGAFAREAKAQLENPACTDRDVHSIRKRAKRLRYASAVLAPVARSDLRGQVAALQKVQKWLGEFQDATIARAAIADLAGESITSHLAFRLGRLDAAEEARAVAAREQLPALLRRLR